MAFQQATQERQLSELEQLVQASGKMVLVDKLLPKLRAEGHKVSLFFALRSTPPSDRACHSRIKAHERRLQFTISAPAIV